MPSGSVGLWPLVRAVIRAARKGDVRAAEIVLSRCWPARKGRPVAVTFPAIGSAAVIACAMGVVTSAVGAGELSPEEGQAVAAVLEAHRGAIETADLEPRIVSLEASGRIPDD